MVVPNGGRVVIFVMLVRDARLRRQRIAANDVFGLQARHIRAPVPVPAVFGNPEGLARRVRVFGNRRTVRPDNRLIHHVAQIREAFCNAMLLPRPIIAGIGVYPDDADVKSAAVLEEDKHPRQGAAEMRHAVAVVVIGGGFDAIEIRPYDDRTIVRRRRMDRRRNGVEGDCAAFVRSRPPAPPPDRRPE